MIITFGQQRVPSCLMSAPDIFSRGNATKPTVYIALSNEIMQILKVCKYNTVFDPNRLNSIGTMYLRTDIQLNRFHLIFFHFLSAALVCYMCFLSCIGYYLYLQRWSSWSVALTEDMIQRWISQLTRGSLMMTMICTANKYILYSTVYLLYTGVYIYKL